ncbi:hypothetical protein AB833_22740 [Chromatiales bacterium (ex Bugula neritina AB1)]|nr:hypothetical protein AB833_22740 [Chromatiales bacterium (ex Bugula neritina AB1)]
MKLLLKIVLPMLVIGVCLVTARILINNKPEAAKRPQFKPTTSIDATTVKKTDFPVVIKAQGSVSASREGSIVSEVAGTIISVSPSFVVGGSFLRGDVLLEIDPRDYEIAVTLTQATFAQSKAALAEETARSEQAAADWKRLGRSGKPSDLTLRKPQLAAARASLAGAKAQVERAQLDLDRTRIVAPYDGRIRQKQVDLGQYVNKGGILASIYSTDTAHVRLPLSNQQQAFVNLPVDGAEPVTVTLHAEIGGTRHRWEGNIIRTEGAIDERTRQLYVVAEVDRPYSVNRAEKPPLLLGQYVGADITGRTLTDVIVIPRSALREDSEVLRVDDLNTLQTRQVQVAWKDSEVAVISDGLEEGDIISLTALGTVTNGTRVRATIDGVAPPLERTKKRPSAISSSIDNDSVTSPELSKKPVNTAGDDGENQQGVNHLQRFKTMIDAGEELPPPVVARMQSRLAAGEPVPDWLREYLKRNAVAN